jgi:hypothetical protein
VAVLADADDLDRAAAPAAALSHRPGLGRGRVRLVHAEIECGVVGVGGAACRVVGAVTVVAVPDPHPGGVGGHVERNLDEFAAVRAGKVAFESLRSAIQRRIGRGLQGAGSRRHGGHGEQAGQNGDED